MSLRHRSQIAVLACTFAACGGSGGGAPIPIDPAPPVVTSIQPASGFVTGGSTVTLRGSSLAAGTPSVRFGGNAATEVTIVDDLTLRCRTPAGGAGSPTVAVTNDRGTTAITDSFTYYSWPPVLAAAEQRIETDVPGTFDSTEPQICAAGNSVYVVWEDNRNGATDIYFNRSLDGGATWLASDVRLDTDVAGAALSLDPRICCDGSSVYVTWADARSGSKDIHFNRSEDGGLTWLPLDVRLDTDTAGAQVSDDPQIACSGQRVYVTWEDDRSGNLDIHFNVSQDGGSTWLTDDLRLATDGNIPGDGADPQICAAGESVYAVWTDTRNGGEDIYFNRSADAGATWLSEDVRLDTDLIGAARSLTPRIDCDGSHVYVVWADLRSTAADIYFNGSTDGGATWLPADVRLDTDAPGAAKSDHPQVACDGSRVYAVWEDARDGSIHFNRSVDAGATWLPADVRLDTAPVGDDSDDPRICSDGGNLFVAWDRGDNTTCDIYLNSSPDGGVTWQTTVVRTDDPLGNGDSDFVEMACSGAQVFLVYEDTRNGEDDVYFARNVPQ